MKIDWMAVALGGAGGALGGLAVYAVTSALLDRQFTTASHDILTRAEPELRAQIDAELAAQIPTRVRSEMDRRFTEAGITPTTGRQLAAVLNAASAIGLIGIRR